MSKEAQPSSTEPYFGMIANIEGPHITRLAGVIPKEGVVGVVPAMPSFGMTTTNFFRPVKCVT